VSERLEGLLGSYVAALRDSAKLLGRLEDLKGWPAETLTDAALGVGWDASEQRVTFPVYADHGATLAGFRRYQSNGSPKMLGDKGVPLELYPPPESLPNAPELWLVEGEGDLLSAHALELWPACCVPGTGAWKPDWVHRLRPYRTVIVCFDCDEPGRKAAERVAGDLASAGIRAQVKDLNPGRDDGYDVTDWLLEAREDE
jgi:DNA primase